IMSTKGMSVVAARTLADRMCSGHDIPLLLLHDFDKAGFSIAGTLQRDTRRYEFQNAIEIIDLGLSLEDVEAMGLESEYLPIGRDRAPKAPVECRSLGEPQAETMAEIARLNERETVAVRALDLLQKDRARAYDKALATLGEETRGRWKESIKPRPQLSLLM